MALSNNFYYEIHTKEKKWIELIENNLLNIYYFKAELTPFYKKRLDQLNYEYSSTNNKIIGQIIEEIEDIIKKLEEFESTYRKGLDIDIKTLIPLFLISKFNNSVKETKNENSDLQRLQIRKQVLEAIKNHYDEQNKKVSSDDYLLDDYLYDDFPENKKVA